MVAGPDRPRVYKTSIKMRIWPLAAFCSCYLAAIAPQPPPPRPNPMSNVSNPGTITNALNLYRLIYRGAITNNGVYTNS